MDPFPDTYFAKTPDGVYITYQVIGDGPIDVVSQVRLGSRLPLGRTSEDMEAELRDIELWGTIAYGRAFL